MHHQYHHYSIVLFLTRFFCVSSLLSVVEFLLADLSLNVRADHFESPEGSLIGFWVSCRVDYCGCRYDCRIQKDHHSSHPLPFLE